MEYVGYQTRSAADASVNERIDFIKKTYVHLGASIIACVGLTSLLYTSEFGQNLGLRMAQNFLLPMILFIGAGMVFEKWARTMGSPKKQYMGLALYVVAESFILLPLLMIAKMTAAQKGQDVSSMIGSAGILTGVIFGGMTITSFVSKKDFSFMGRTLHMLSFAAMGFIIVSMVFSVNLGNIFALAMVVLMAGYVLYYTSTITRHYPVGSHVAASLALFSAIATMFWYVLMLFMGSRD
jgi:FtsH-binding integral membrane protein